MSILNEITKEKFEEYKSVQECGQYNMLDPLAREETTLDKKQWFAIISNYDLLSKKWGF